MHNQQKKKKKKLVGFYLHYISQNEGENKEQWKEKVEKERKWKRKENFHPSCCLFSREKCKKMIYAMDQFLIKIKTLCFTLSQF